MISIMSLVMNNNMKDIFTIISKKTETEEQ